MNEFQTDIAIVIPCFNGGDFLSESLESLFAQTYQNWEAVLVDDGSTDPVTLSLLEKIDHPKVKVHQHTKNRGLAATRNTGIRMTNAPIIMTLDQDDHIMPDALEVVIRYFEEAPEVDVFYPDVIHFGEENRIRVNPEFDFPSLVSCHFIQAQSPFRRSVFNKAGGYCEHETLRMGMEDVDFWYGVLETGACFRRLPKPVYRYRMHAGTLSRGIQQRNNYEIRRFIADQHRKLLKGRLRQEFLQIGAVRSYRTAIACRDWRKALLNSFRLCRHCLWPPKMWWRASWNVADALKNIF